MFWKTYGTSTWVQHPLYVPEPIDSIDIIYRIPEKLAAEAFVAGGSSSTKKGTGAMDIHRAGMIATPPCVSHSS